MNENACPHVCACERMCVHARAHTHTHTQIPVKTTTESSNLLVKSQIYKRNM